MDNVSLAGATSHGQEAHAPASGFRQNLVAFARRHLDVCEQTSPRSIAQYLIVQPLFVRLLAVFALLVGAYFAVRFPLYGLTVGGSLWAIARSVGYLRLRLRAPGSVSAVIAITLYVAALAFLVIGVPSFAPYALILVLFGHAVCTLLCFPRRKTNNNIWLPARAVVYSCGALLTLWWPDLAWTLIAYVFALWLVRTAFRIAVGARLANAVTGRAQYHLKITASVLVVVVMAGAVFGSVYLRSLGNTVDDFYDYSEPIGEPGTLIRVADYDGPHPQELAVKRILFASTDSAGNPAIASGIIALPASRATTDTANAAALPLVLWEHGTNGLNPTCALSAGPAALDPQAFPALDHIVENQWAVVAPDFMSHANPQKSPYLVGIGQAQFALDSVRAAHSLTYTDLLPENDSTQTLPFTNDTVIWGHSQGGNAALWTAQYGQTYAPELTFSGTAALSPAAKPLELGLSLTTDSASAAVGIVVSYVLGAYSAAYPDVEANDHVTHNGMPIYQAFSQRCTNASAAGSIITALALNEQGNNVFTNFASDTALGARLVENSPTGPFPHPLFVGWGSEDEVISADLQHQYVDVLCAAGTNLTSIEYPGRTHMDVLHTDSPLPQNLSDWTTQRFAGTAPTSSCSQ